MLIEYAAPDTARTAQSQSVTLIRYHRKPYASRIYR